MFSLFILIERQLCWLAEKGRTMTIDDALRAYASGHSSLTDGIDTATPTGRLLFHFLASIAEMERELIRERTMAGLLAARSKNGPGRGRKSVLTPKKRATAMELLAAGDRPRDVAEAIGVSVPTFYRHFPAGEGEPAS
jgi:DNA invertase Pin-like site-specific DNA recombinase